MIKVRLVVTLPLYNKLQTTLTVLCNMLKLNWCIGRAVKDDNPREKKVVWIIGSIVNQVSLVFGGREGKDKSTKEGIKSASTTIDQIPI